MGAFFRAQAEEATHTHWQIVHIAPTSTPGEPCCNQLSQSLPPPRMNGICILHTFKGQSLSSVSLLLGAKELPTGNRATLGGCPIVHCSWHAMPSQNYPSFFVMLCTIKGA